MDLKIEWTRVRQSRISLVQASAFVICANLTLTKAVVACFRVLFSTSLCQDFISHLCADLKILLIRISEDAKGEEKLVEARIF